MCDCGHSVTGRTFGGLEAAREEQPERKRQLQVENEPAFWDSRGTEREVWRVSAFVWGCGCISHLAVGLRGEGAEGDEFSVSQQCALLLGQTGNGLLGCMEKSVASKSQRRFSSSFCFALLRSHLESFPDLGHRITELLRLEDALQAPPVQAFSFTLTSP